MGKEKAVWVDCLGEEKVDCLGKEKADCLGEGRS